MRPLLFVAASLVVGIVTVGCVNESRSSRRVDPSVLPAQAKALLSNDAQITSVTEEHYSKGTKIYTIHYTKDGQAAAIRYNTKEQSTPTGVFESMH